jgi:hypothetical protein
MRKTLWGCAAAALAVLGAGLLAWDYACDHPDSWLGRGFHHAEHAAATQVKTMEVGRHTAELALTSMQGLLGQGTATPCPDEGQAEDVCHAEPAVLPGPVVMCGEDDETPREPMPPVHDLVGGRPGVGEECELVKMPPAPEDAAKMPPCDADGCRPQSKKGTAPEPVMPGCHDEPACPKMDRDGGEKPAHPDVDTTEVRPGELWFIDLTDPF